MEYVEPWPGHQQPWYGQGSSQNIFDSIGGNAILFISAIIWQILAIFSTILCLEPEMTA